MASKCVGCHTNYVQSVFSWCLNLCSNSEQLTSRKQILKQKSFQEYVQTTYQIASGSIMQEDTVDKAFELETTNGVEE